MDLVDNRAFLENLEVELVARSSTPRRNGVGNRHSLGVTRGLLLAALSRLSRLSGVDLGGIGFRLFDESVV